MSNDLSLILYLFTYISSGCFLYASKKFKGKKIDILFIIGIALPVLLAALRNNVGTDFLRSLYSYIENSKTSFIDWYESNSDSFDGTPFAVWAISQICGWFDSSEMFFGVFALISFLPFALRLKLNYSQEICFLAAFMFLTSTFTGGMNIMKQTAAASIIFWGLEYVYERKFWKYAITVLIASFFHITAFVAIVIYFLYSNHIENFGIKKIIITIISSIAISFYPYVLSLLGGRFESYQSYSADTSNMSFYLNAAWLFVFLVLHRTLLNYGKKNDLLITLALVSVIIGLLGFSSPYLKRIALYFRISQPLLFAQLPFTFSKEEKTFIQMILFLYIIAIFIITYYILGQAEIMPYNFV